MVRISLSYNHGSMTDQGSTGAMGISAFYGKAAGDEERLQFLDNLYATGCHFWDSADVYGDCEELLGKWYAIRQPHIARPR